MIFKAKLCFQAKQRSRNIDALCSRLFVGVELIGMLMSDLLPLVTTSFLAPGACSCRGKVHLSCVTYSWRTRTSSWCSSNSYNNTKPHLQVRFRSTWIWSDSHNIACRPFDQNIILVLQTHIINKQISLQISLFYHLNRTISCWMDTCLKWINSSYNDMFESNQNYTQAKHAGQNVEMQMWAWARK